MTTNSQPAHAGAGWPDRLTSGTHQIPLDRIIIGRRYRKDFGNLQALADSILNQGLLQPIGITRDWRLVFGERRLRAIRDVLGLESIEARVVDVPSILAGEHAENEIRQDFTPSERVAIAEALRLELGDRHGSNQHGPKEEVDCGPPPPEGKSRDLAAQRAGFESGRQLDRATNVVKLAIPAVVEAMDRGAVSITAAAEIAKAAPADQAQIVALAEPERLEEIRRRKADAARLRAAVAEQEQATGPTAYTGFIRKNGRLPDATEAQTIATLDQRETPSESGKRVKPGTSEPREDRAERKRQEQRRDDLWNLRQALHHLVAVFGEPAEIVAAAKELDHEAFAKRLTSGCNVLNRFAREYQRHGK